MIKNQIKKIVFILTILATLLASCTKLEIEKGTPDCIKKKIRDYNKGPCEDARVEEYKFQGETVYVFEPGTCGNDMTADVTDSDCNELGFLGGFWGNTKINGEEFSNATFVKTTWEK